MSGQQWLQQKHSNHLIRISDGTHTVLAPLPETFGFTVGSEFSAPFDVSLGSGILQKTLAITNISQKLGLRMKKMYANPEPSEISFDLEFQSYYSAADEVIIPIIRLAVMSLGKQVTTEDLKEKKERVEAIVSDKIAGSVDLIEKVTSEEDSSGRGAEYAKNILDFIGIIQGPDIQTIRFGNIYTIERCYITSMSPQFSNVLDKRGYPVSATCSVTATIEQYPIADDMLEWFGRDRESIE